MQSHKAPFYDHQNLIALSIGLGVTLLLLTLAVLRTVNQAERQFEAETALLESQLVHHLSATTETAKDLALLFQASDQVDHDEFQIFTTPMLSRNEHITSAAYLPLVIPSERASFEQRIQQTGLPTFSIRSHEGTEAAHRHFPLLYIEPFTVRNSIMLGTDFTTVSGIQEGIEHAISDGHPTFVNNGDPRFARTLLLQAVYSGRYTPENEEQRTSRINGLILLGIDARKLFTDTTKLGLKTDLSYRVHDDLWHTLASHPGSNETGLFRVETDHHFNVGELEFRLVLARGMTLSKLSWDALLLALLTGSLLTLALYRRAYLVRERERVLEREKAEITHEVARQTSMLRQVLTTIPVRVYWKDLKGRYLGGNQQFIEDAGVSSSESLIGLTDADLPWSSSAERLTRDDQRVLQSGLPLLGLEVNIEKDGERHWFEFNRVPFISADDQVIGVLGTYHDISARKNAEQALQDRSERDRRLRGSLLQLTGPSEGDLTSMLQRICAEAAHTLRLARVSVWRLDHESSTLHCLDLYLTAENEHRCNDQFPLESDSAYLAAIRSGKDLVAKEAQGDPRTVEFADSYLRPLDIRSMLDVPIHLGDALFGVICCEQVGQEQNWQADEIEYVSRLAILVSGALQSDQRKQAQRALEQSEHSLAEAQSIAHLGNWEWELESNRSSWSDEVYRIYGWEPGAVQPDQQRLMEAVHPEDREQVENSRDVTLAGDGRRSRMQHRIILPDGNIRHVEQTCRIERNAAGEAVRMLGVVQDKTSEVKATEDLQLFRQMIENSADPVLLVDTDEGGRLAYVNEAAVKHYGYPREELLTWTIPDWDANYKLEDLPKLIEDLKQSIVNNEGITIETLHRVKGGDLVPVELTISQTRYKGHFCYFGYFKNITERKEVERRITEAKEQAEAAAALKDEAQRIAHLGNWEWDIQNSTLDWSSEIYRIFGWKPHAFKPDYQRFAAAIHPEDREKVEQAVVRALQEPNYRYHIVHRIIHEDGDVRHVEEMGRVERNAAGKAVKMVGVVQDISERVKAQEDLELFRMMIENSADPFFLIDNDEGGRLAYVNEAAVRHYGHPREELLTWLIPDWDPNFTHEDLPKHVEEIKKHAVIGEGMTIETMHKVKGGDLVPVELSLNLTRYKGHLCHFGYIKNITERKEAERRLTRAKEEAEAAAAMKSEFLANMSHEIRTPMNAVINLSRLALQTRLDDRQRDYISKVLRSGENLLGIINDILDFSKIESGMLDIEQIPFDLITLIGEVSDVIAHRSGKSDLEVLLDVPHNLPARLRGDPLRLRQVLINLLNNAIKFTEHGEVALAIDVQEIDDDTLRLDFFVCDTGIGMSREQQGKLFQAFQQADGTITRRFGGTGLGLAISQRLVNMMGGVIHLESQPGHGSTFSFTLDFERLARGTESTSRQPRLSELRALVVDDNNSARQVLEGMLGNFHASAHSCADGEEALAELEQACLRGHPYDLLLIDWKMPHLDGIETCRRLMENPQINHKPRTILVTAYTDDLHDRVNGTGITDIVEKPVNPSVLFNLINEEGAGRPLESTEPTDSKLESDLALIAGARILLVEDNEINQQIAMELLSAIGLEVVTADNGREALELLDEDDAFELILMDLQMPLMDGYEATRAIRQRPKWQDLPIIAMTAHAMSTERDRCLAAGMNDHISKPIDVDAMHAALLRWVEPREQNTVPELTHTEADGQLPEHLPGIDLQRGLLLLGGNHELYARLLLSFADSNANAPERLRAALEEGRREDAGMITHSIKGVAGNLGAMRLSEAAGDLDRLIGQGVEAAQYATALEHFLENFDEVMLSITSLSKKADASPVPVAQTALDNQQREQLQTDLIHFIELLDDDLGEANELFKSIALRLQNQPERALCSNISNALVDYDTDAAEAHARELITKLITTEQE